jgi:hypothetical protein
MFYQEVFGFYRTKKMAQRQIQALRLILKIPSRITQQDCSTQPIAPLEKKAR